MLEGSHLFEQKPKSIVSSFEQKLHRKEQKLEDELNLLVGRLSKVSYNQLFNEDRKHYEYLFREEGMILLAYEKDTLKFWSDNVAPVDMVLNNTSFHSDVIRIKNGWYKVNRRKDFDRKYFGLILLRREYPKENEYLVNAFTEGFNLPENISISFETGENNYPIKSLEGDEIFSLKVEQRIALPIVKLLLLALLNILGFILLIAFLVKECDYLSKHIGLFWASAVFVGLIIGLRIWMLNIAFPNIFYETDLFSPALYATSFLFPSLGDFLINASLMFYLAFFIQKRLKASSLYWNQIPRGKALIYGLLLMALVLSYATLITNLFKGLIENSNIYFNINNLFDLSPYSVVGIIVVGTLLFSFYLFALILLREIMRLGLTFRNYLLLLLVATPLYILALHWWGNKDLILVLWPLEVLLVVGLLRFKSNEQYSFSSIIILLIIYSFFAAHTLTKFSNIKEEKSRIVFAERLSSDEDPVTEFLYAEMEKQLVNDDLILKPFLDSAQTIAESEFEQQLKEDYFDKDWDKYEIKTYTFNADSTSVLQKNKSKNFTDLNTLIQESGQQSALSPNLYHIQNSTERLSYIIKLPLMLSDKSTPFGFLFFELKSKLIPEEIGFPELLLDKSTENINNLIAHYSHARYVNGSLVNQYGTYTYGIKSNLIKADTVQATHRYRGTYLENLEQHMRRVDEKTYFLNDDDGYNHLVYKVDENTFVVLTKQQETFISKSTTFSYLFVVFSVILMVVLIVRNLSRGFYIRLNLKSKIQFLLVGVVLTSLILFGLGTKYYIEGQYKEKNHNLISEKIHSVQIEVANKLKSIDELDASLTPYMVNLLNKFSLVFFTDINIFDTDGTLLASSRPEIFDIGLVSSKMNLDAYSHMVVNKKSEYIHEEEIGKLRYLSAYVPFRNKNDKVLAYLNLPYFAKQNELEKEISTFLIAIINIFVLLFVLSIMAALLVSNWITQPLKAIQKSLVAIELDKANKPIQYHGSDEIGSLVGEYNKKLLELEKQAELLAKSERESAWREMAKQVAHEIKNPLTPMKLSVQHLQRSWEDKVPDWDKRLARFTNTLIEQIDTLTTIANEFSNFAKMPKARNEQLDLVQTLRATVGLYSELEDVKVGYYSEVEPPQYVMADKEQLLRVFNNLVKNAIQAIPSERQGKIDVILIKSTHSYIVEVKDNGEGIPEDKMDKIFVPNFTTKSTGMGLGLAMVKSMIINAGGKVWFDTEVGKGSSFYVSLPIYENE